MESRVGIIGLGYVGLPLALTAAENGWHVIGLDKNDRLVENLASGESHIDDVSNERILKSISLGKFSVTKNPSDLAEVDICIICVPTPTTENHDPDLTYLISATKTISRVLKPSCIVVNESTSFPGTLRSVIQQEVVAMRRELGDIAGYVAAPERVDPKNTLFNHSNTHRVLGGDNPQQVEKIAKFYRSLGPEVTIVSSSEAAELSKLIENAFRLVNISFVNELVPYASAIGVDLIEVINAASTKPFGFMKFNPGPGVGGHCIPVDPHYLLNSASGLNVQLPVLSSAVQVNLEIPAKIVNTVKKILNGKLDSYVLLIGIAYKDGISDTRETPALPIALGLVAEGLKVCWVDEEVEQWDFAPRFASQEIGLAIALSSSTMQQVQNVSFDVTILDCTGRYSGLSNVISYFNS